MLVFHGVSCSYASEMSYFLDVMEGGGLGFVDGKFNFFHFEIPDVYGVMGGGGPLFDNIKEEDAIPRIFLDNLLSIELVLVIPEGQPGIGHNTTNSLLFLAKSYGHNSSISV